MSICVVVSWVANLVVGLFASCPPGYDDGPRPVVCICGFAPGVDNNRGLVVVEDVDFLFHFSNGKRK